MGSRATGQQFRGSGDMKQKRRRWNDVQKHEFLFSLILHGGNVKQTARKIEMAERELYVLKAKAKEDGRYAEVEREVAVVLMDRRKGIAYKFLDALENSIGEIEGKIPDASLKDLAVSIGILTDKLMLVSGEPTERIETRNENRNLNISAELDARVNRAYEGIAGALGGNGKDPAGEVDTVV